MEKVRPPVVAGRFYPADPRRSRSAVADYLAAARPVVCHPKALIVPHAGYVYSGPIAASGHVCLESQRDTVHRVVLLGTAHQQGVVGLAASSADAFATPLGVVPLDREALAAVEEKPQVIVNDEAHRYDHALEVQLPFLQVVLKEFRIVPFLVGRTSPEEVAEVLEELWGGEETLLVVSSDLSHYLPYEMARERDLATAQAIEALRFEEINPEQACGHRAIRGLLCAARPHRLRALTLDLRNSGETAGPRDKVVGYGAFAACGLAQKIDK